MSMWRKVYRSGIILQVFMNDTVVLTELETNKHILMCRKQSTLACKELKLLVSVFEPRVLFQ